MANHERDIETSVTNLYHGRLHPANFDIDKEGAEEHLRSVFPEEIVGALLVRKALRSIDGDISRANEIVNTLIVGMARRHHISDAAESRLESLGIPVRLG